MNLNESGSPPHRPLVYAWLGGIAVWACAWIAAPAQAQDCTPFLEVLGADRQSTVLSLNTCEVVAAEPWLESPSAKAWQLKPAALQRWTSALAGEHLTLALLDAQLRTRHLADGLQSGPLLNRISARLVNPASWRWDARRGEIALIEVPPAGADLCREKRPLLFWFGTRDIAQGGLVTAQVNLVYSSSYVKGLPNGCIDAWRIEPAQHATVDPQGLVKIADNAPDGAAVTLIALVGPKEVRGALRVMDMKRNQVIGTWRQVSETPCESGKERVPADPVREFKLDGNGQFSVTTTPFEAYKDYWGTYAYDAASGAIRFSVESGNKLPKGVKLTGWAASGNGQLELKDISLWPPKDGAAICGVQFAFQRG